jgi:ferredoxin/tRNA A-37 threonylcarbamoyl transferase component Bud32
MKKIALEPLGESAVLVTGAPVLSALLAKNLKVLMSCGGKGICSTCHVRVCAGMEQLSPAGAKERRTLALVADATPQSRLACQAAVYGDGITVAVPEGMYIEKADDLLGLLGTPAPENVLHPVNGAILIPKGKLITRTLLEQSRGVEQEVRQLRAGGAGTAEKRSTFIASGITIRPTPGAQTTHAVTRASVETTSDPGRPRPVAAGPPPGPSRPVETSGASRTVTRPSDRSPAGAAVTSVHPVAPAVAVTTPPPRTSTAIYPGAQVGKYLLLEQVGKGGAGVVYRALHSTLKTIVAVKFLHAELGAEDEDGRERLAREAQLLARLDHPNVVRVLDFEDHPTRPYVVMEFVDGLTAADLITQSGRLAPRRAIDVALDMAAGLGAAHALGIVHRDVKPSNVLVARSGGSKLVDLGLATLGRPDRAAAPAAGGPIEGTVGYMSPEALNATETDHRSDIYSLGVTLFHLASGRLPFGGTSLAEVMMKHLLQPPPALHELVPEIPPQLSTVIQTMMAKTAGQRFQTYAELRDELKQARQRCAGW